MKASLLLYATEFSVENSWKTLETSVIFTLQVKKQTKQNLKTKVQMFALKSLKMKPLTD